MQDRQRKIHKQADLPPRAHSLTIKSVFAYSLKAEELAPAVLEGLALNPDSNVAQLYDPLLMPAELE